MILILGHGNFAYWKARLEAFEAQLDGIPARYNYRIDRGWYLRFD